MDFVEIDIQCHDDLREILTAELGLLGYESFLDTAEGFKAYQPVKNHNPELVAELLVRYEMDTQFESRKLCDKNWNEVWEKTFEPIEIDDLCRVRASFHSSKEDFEYEIVIDPKMSFGTGHHETTRQAIRYLLDTDLKDTTVLDVGCGTGILSILAELKGASKVFGIDNDTYAISNAVENLVLNECKNIKIREGTVKDFNWSEKFDIIVANINRNVLLKEIEYYNQLLCDSGKLILSGFYTYDSPTIVKKCEDHNLVMIAQTEENQWACLLIRKPK